MHCGSSGGFLRDVGFLPPRPSLGRHCLSHDWRDRPCHVGRRLAFGGADLNLSSSLHLALLVLSPSFGANFSPHSLFKALCDCLTNFVDSIVFSCSARTYKDRSFGAGPSRRPGRDIGACGLEAGKEVLTDILIGKLVSHMMNVLRSGPNSSVSFILIPLLPVKLMVSNMNLNVATSDLKFVSLESSPGYPYAQSTRDETPTNRLYGSV